MASNNYFQCSYIFVLCGSVEQYQNSIKFTVLLYSHSKNVLAKYSKQIYRWVGVQRALLNPTLISVISTLGCSVVHSTNVLYTVSHSMVGYSEQIDGWCVLTSLPALDSCLFYIRL